MIFLLDISLAGGWGSALCKDTAFIKALLRGCWYLQALVLVAPNPQPLVFHPFSFPHILYAHQRCLETISPCSLFLILFLSALFPVIMVFRLWWYYEWLALSLAVIWYATVLHKSFVFPHAESVASRIKPVLQFLRSKNPCPTHPQTNPIMTTDW